MTTKSFAHKVNKKFYYGWVIVFVAALAMFFSSPGQTYSISAFIDAYIKEFNFSRTQISTIYSIATIVSGMLLIIMGKMVDRYGPKRMLMISGLMLAATALFNSFTNTLPMLAMGFFFSRYFGQGSMSLIPGTLVPQWFKKHRGLAFSIFKYGNAIAAVLVPVMNVYMIRQVGWQGTWRLWSIALVVVFVPIVMLLVINTPEEIGLKPDNIVLNPEETAEEAADVEQNSWHLKEAVKTSGFWYLGFASMITPLITTGIVFHFFSIMDEKGISPTGASLALGLMGIPGFVFPLIAGYLIDHIQEKSILVIAFVAEFIGLMFMTMGTSTTAAIAAILFYGIGMSIIGVAVGVMWPNLFGRKYLGSIQGIATVFGVIGSAFGPLPFGMAFDLFGSYTLILAVMAGLSLLGAVLSFLIKKPIKGTMVFEIRTNET